MAKSFSGRVSTTGGAYIPLSDIPNAPPLPGAPQLPQYQNLNYGKRTYHEAGVGEPINMASRAAALQQEELPKGFEQGLARAAAAAGTGQEAMGKAFERGAYQMSKSLNAAGSVIGDYQQKVMQSADIASYWEAKRILSDSNSEFEAEAALKPATERRDLYLSKYAPRNAQALSQLGLSQEYRDRIFGLNANNDITITGNLAHANTEELRKNSFQTMENAETNAIAKKKFFEAREAIDDQFIAGHINEATRDEKKRKVTEWEDKGYVEDHTARDPAFVVKHIEETVFKGKESDLYPHLNTDKAAATKAHGEALTEWNRRREGAQTEILNDILDGGKPVSAVDIQRRGREGGLEEKDIANLVKAAETDVPFDPTAVANATKAVSDYRDQARDDKDMSKRNAIYGQIVTTTPKEIQKLLTEELNASWKNRNDPGTPQQKELGETYQLIDQYRKSGMLVGKDAEGKEVTLPSGLGTEEGEKTKIVDKVAFQAAEQRRSDLYFAAQAYVKDNPHFKAGELKKYINGLAAPDAQQKADNAAGGSMPAPPRPTFYRAAPSPIPPGMEWRYGPSKPGEAPAGGPQLPTQGPVTEEEKAERVRQLQQRKESASAVGTPRSLRETTSFTKAWTRAGVLTGESGASDLTVTAYTPGKGDISMEGKDEVASRSGRAYTMEDYQEGKTPWVSVAMDDTSDWQGKFLISPSYPGVIFKVEDTGSAFKGQGESKIDIAFRDGSKATNYKESAPFAPITKGEMARIESEVGGQKVGQEAPKLKGVNPELLTRLGTLQQQFGKLEITSGYRDPAHNAAVGGARGSQHTHGNAVDINVKGMSIAERLALIEAASQAGITGIGVYNNALHFDVGPRRAWGPSYRFSSVPAWAHAAINKHVNG